MIIIDHRFIGRGRVRAVSCVCGFSIFVPADDIGRSRKHLGRLFRHLSFFSFMGQQVRVATSTDSLQCDAVCVSAACSQSLSVSAQEEKGKVEQRSRWATQSGYGSSTGRSVGRWFFFYLVEYHASAWPAAGTALLLTMLSLST